MMARLEVAKQQTANILSLGICKVDAQAIDDIQRHLDRATSVPWETLKQQFYALQPP
jgi:hypothetical protein